jgi:hypothetical protein
MIKITFLIISFILSSVILSAQSGPGGVGTSSSLVLWIDINALALGNGSLVQNLNDISGNSNIFTQSAAGYQATLTTSALNGKSVLNFSGNHYDLNNFTNFEGLTETTSFFVANYNSLGTSQFIFNIRDSQNNQAYCTRTVNSSFTQYYLTGSSVNRVLSTANTNYNIHTSNWNASTGAFGTHINSATISTRTDAGQSFNGITRIRIGRPANAFSNSFDGNLAEMIYFNTAINTTQRIIIENYLSSKYALALSANDKYTLDATHGNEVAGIGQTSATDNHTAAQGTSILLIENPAGMADGEFAMWGHDAAGTGSNNTDFMSGDTTQLDQEWRWDETGGDVGAVDVTFDMTGISMGTDPTKYILIATDDGDFTTNRSVLGDGNAVGVNNLSVVGDLITFSNVDLTDLDYFTIAYNGQLDDAIALNFAGVQENWSSALTWDINQVPDSSLNAIIFGGGNDVLIDVNSTINDLTVESASSLTIDNGITLQIFGDLKVESGATLTCNTGSTISFESQTGTQRILNNSANTVTFYNLSINNTFGVSLSNGPAGLSSALDLVDGTFTINDNFTFLSDASVTGHIETVGATANLTGNIIAQRFGDTRNAGWNDISSPAVGSTIADLDDDLFISGVAGADGYAASTAGGGFVSIYKMDNVTQAWEAVANVTDAMTNGVGFEIWLGDDLSTFGGKTWTMAGSIDLTNTTQQTLDIETGWNLVGNPYPAFLDFEAISGRAGNVTNNEFWTVEAATNTFVVKNSLQMIPPGQGFWVLTSSGTDLTIDPTTDFIASNSTAMYKNDYIADEEVRILIQNQDSDKPLGSNVYLRKNQNAYAGADYLDIPALKRPEPKSCHIAFDNLGKQNLVNYVSTNKEHLELPLNIESGMAANFTMTFEGIDQFSEYQCINLVNDATGEKIPLTSESKYEFKLGENEPVNMRLILSKEDYADCLAPSMYSAGDVSVTTQGKTVFTDFSLDRGATAQIRIIDMLGNTIVSETRNVGYNRETFNLENAGSGVYLISVTINGDTQTEKVILQ